MTFPAGAERPDMELASLPDRPLALAELQDLERTDRFRSVVPAAVFDLEDGDRRLVPAVVLLTDSRVVAAGYDIDAGAWIRVETADAPDDSEAEERAREAADRLQEWATDTGQTWAEPDGADALLDEL